MTRDELLHVALLQATEEGVGIHLAKFADMCIEWGQQHPHWISVEDKMPPMRDEDGMSDKVLTHSKGGGIYFNRYDYGHNTWGNPIAFNITHWMPFPQPPKKGCEE